ncbi:MAG: hypothetical protein FWH51_01955, partial [Dehalococcoidia bacterium]|nr:hypothetical protein [Dehalococcoidia bacterium]
KTLSIRFEVLIIFTLLETFEYYLALVCKRKKAAPPLVKGKPPCIDALLSSRVRETKKSSACLLA